MSPWQEPLYIQRVWCVFEFSHAMAEKKASKHVGGRFRLSFKPFEAISGPFFAMFCLLWAVLVMNCTDVDGICAAESYVARS